MGYQRLYTSRVAAPSKGGRPREEGDVFGFASGVVGNPLRLEDARFSAEDLAGLGNGSDNMYLTEKKQYLKMGDDEWRSCLARWRK